MVLSRDRFHSVVHVLLQSPPKLPNKLFTAPLCTCIHVLVVDGAHAPTKALRSDCLSGLCRTNGNEAPGTGALGESM